MAAGNGTTGSETVGTGTESLPVRVRSILPSLTPAGARIARLLLDDEALAARSTITELSELAQTSEATVVRTARALGFRGYPELRLALAAETARADTVRTVTGDIAQTDPLTDVVAKLAAAEVAAVTDTAAGLDTAVLDRVIDAIVGARRVNVYGVGASALIALDLQQKLDRIGRDCHAYGDTHGALTSAVLLGPADVVVGVSYTGETVDVVEPVHRAAAAGAITVAITNHPRSSLAELADHVLVPAGREMAFRPGALASRISQLLVVDCIFVGIAQRTSEETCRALDLTREAVAERRERRPRRRH